MQDCYCDMFRLFRIAILRVYILQKQYRFENMPSSLVNGTDKATYL